MGMFLARVGIFIFYLLSFGVSSVEITTDNVTLFFFAKENRNEPQKINSANLSDLSTSNFKSSRLNYFIIHGLYCNYKIATNAKNALLDQIDVNVFLVDYSGPASAFEIHDAAIVATGRIIAYFISLMKTAYDLFAEDFILVGFSMGSHIAGEIGRHLDGEIDTIVALDPANMTPPIVYIDTEKAYFVQSVHTSSIGLTVPVGHASYFVNTIDQPGCNYNAMCSHERAIDYYVESLESGGFSAVECENYKAFLFGLCNSNQKSYLGGIDIDKSANGKFYLATNSKPPYSKESLS